MVQITKTKLKREPMGLKTTRTTKVRYTDGRKGAPVKKKVTAEYKKVSAAIHGNIESIMTARVKHAGGHLSILKPPSDVYEYAKGGARLSDKQMALRADQTKWRKAKTSERQKELKMELDMNIRKAEKERLKKLIRQQHKDAELRREKLRDVTKYEELSDDDVAGNFFDDEIGEDFDPKVEPLPLEAVGAKGKRSKKQSPQQDGGSSSSTSTATGSKEAASSLTNEEKEILESKKIAHLARSAGFRGVRDKTSAKLLEDPF